MMNYEKLKQKAELHALKVKQKQEIKELYHSNDKERKPWTFSKKLTAFIIANCTIIEIYALVIMWIFGDLSALPTLITAIIGESVGMCAYIIKATIENRTDGITYETAMFNLRNNIHPLSELSEEELSNTVG